ncbi:hypothetical protein KKI90_13970 [Xenorhabdus bovienii]|uniref:hypothetical protein n=1 Tax=Xenorhabdus bovienii TaxID=40576 RepID=UPI00237D24CF|nr:hypothetical protein [Xenorhabdus bovienii]MDE1487508.1 hypothetical protein [Xenorhabdus bovienii]MDE9478356.1 hypothetical protein [Xenorhabdus bovienii]MDE9531237.1 hypothetical protein [Xenorhabdus bovienii]
MNTINELLNKINKEKSGDTLSLADIISMSFSEFRHRSSEALIWRETNLLYKQAHHESKQSKLAELRILSRANPQLANTTNLDISPSSQNSSYNNWFYGRAHRFVKPGSVAGREHTF